MSVKFSAVVIGCGKIGAGGSDYPLGAAVSSHCAAYAHSLNTRLTAVCDADEQVARAAAKKHGASTWFVDVASLLATRPELVSICTPTETHASLFEEVIACPSVKGVLLEKPVARNLTEAHRITQIAAVRGIPVLVNYSRRFSSRIRALAQWLHEGGLGSLQHVTGSYTKNVVHNGSHWLDLARLLVGEIVGVKGFVSQISHLKEEGTINVMLDFANGARGYLVGYDERFFTIFEMDIFGTAGRLRIVDLGRGFEIYSVTESLRHPGYRELVRTDGASDGLVENPLLYAVDNLAACVRGERPLDCALSDGLRALELADAALSCCGQVGFVRVESDL